MNLLSMDHKRHYFHSPEFLYLKEFIVLSIKGKGYFSSRKLGHNSNYISNYVLVFLSWSRNSLSDITFLAKIKVGKTKFKMLLEFFFLTLFLISKY